MSSCLVRRHRDDLAIADDLVLRVKGCGIPVDSFLSSAPSPSQRTRTPFFDLLESRRDEDPHARIGACEVSAYQIGNVGGNAASLHTRQSEASSLTIT
jgi:hypothetical protein